MKSSSIMMEMMKMKMMKYSPIYMIMLYAVVEFDFTIKKCMHMMNQYMDARAYSTCAS